MSSVEKAPSEKFKDELRNVFLRWWEESDLDELDMGGAAIEVIEEFCESGVEFEPDPKFLQQLDEDEYDG